MKKTSRSSAVTRLNVILIVVTVALCNLANAQTAGDLWGMTTAGGSDGAGIIFRTGPDGSNFVVAHNFPTPIPGAGPQIGLTAHPNGKLYSFTVIGGLYASGVIFSYDPVSGVYAREFDLNIPDQGQGAMTHMPRMVLASNSKFYGTTSVGGANGEGMLFEYDPATKSFVNRFDFPSGAFPLGLIQASDGKLYGLTANAGTNNIGSIFSFDPGSGNYNTEYSFAFASGSSPRGALLEASDGILYGTTFGGGVHNAGTLFSFNKTSKVYTDKYDLSTSSGTAPIGTLTEGPTGVLLGVCSNGGANAFGTLFDFAIASGTFTKRYDFVAASSGIYPSTSLTVAGNGLAYGEAQGVDNSVGMIYEYDPIGFSYTKRKDLSNFFSSTPMLLSNNKLYGLLGGGDTSVEGVLFEYNTTGPTYVEKVTFGVYPEGSSPRGTLTQMVTGKVFGTCTFGGSSLGGTLFELDLATGTPTIRVNFNSATGMSPDGGMTEYNGLLYGVAATGGANNGGTIYSFDPVTGTVTKVYDFTTAGGSSPNRTLVAANNKFYGTTRSGAANGFGAVFEFDPASNTYTKKHDFAPATGSTVRGIMVLASNGKLYGTTNGGGANSLGVLFEFDPMLGTYTKEVDFNSTSGAGNFGPLVSSPGGKLYFVTDGSGANGDGTILEYVPGSTSVTKKYDFTSNSGAFSTGGLMMASNGRLYGLANFGGNNDLGTVYEYDPATNTFTKKTDLTGLNGAIPSFLSVVQIGKTQTLAFNALPAKTFGDVPFNITASASSGLSVTFSSSDPTIASVANNLITILKAGTVTITATQAGNAAFYPITSSQSLTINKADQSISFSAIPSKKVNDPPFDLTATTSSGLAVNYQSSTPTVATVSGHTITILAAGSTTISGSQSGDGNYNAAPVVNQILSVSTVTGLESESEMIIAYPNPANSKLIVRLPSQGLEKQIGIFSIDGKPLEQRTSINSEEQFSLGEFPKGMYILKVQIGAEISWLKVFKN